MPAPVGPVWYPGGVYGDVCAHPTGYAFAVVVNGRQRVQIYVGDLTAAPTLLWETDASRPLLWLRVAVDQGTGEVQAFATNQDDRPVLIEETGETILAGDSVNQRASMIKHEGGDFVAYINRTNLTYTRWPLAGADPGPFANPFTSSGTSQGFLDVVGGSLLWANTVSGGVDTGAYTLTVQGKLIRYAVTQGGVIVGQSQGNSANPDAGLAARDGGSIVQRVIPTLCHELYVAPFGNGDAAWAICARTPTVNGGNACLVIAPPWSGDIVATGSPSSGSGGAGTPTSNTIHSITRPPLPKSKPPRTYPHVAAITIAKTVEGVSAPVREAMAASQQSTRLLWDHAGMLNDELKALKVRFDTQAETNLQLRQELRAVSAKAVQALAVSGKITAQRLAIPPGPTLPPDDGQVGGPPPPPPGGGAVVVPGTADAIDAQDVTWMTTNPANWPIGATITSVQITPSQICLDYTGKSVWPAVDPSGDGVLSPGNPWVIAFIGGQYDGSTYEWLRVGQICKNVTGPEFQDYVTGTSPLDTWAPALGETVWFMVSALARNGPQSPVNQRTQIVAVTWPF